MFSTVIRVLRSNSWRCYRWWFLGLGSRDHTRSFWTRLDRVWLKPFWLKSLVAQVVTCPLVVKGVELVSSRFVLLHGVELVLSQFYPMVQSCSRTDGAARWLAGAVRTLQKRFDMLEARDSSKILADTSMSRHKSDNNVETGNTNPKVVVNDWKYDKVRVRRPRRAAEWAAQSLPMKDRGRALCSVPDLDVPVATAPVDELVTSARTTEFVTQAAAILAATAAPVTALSDLLEPPVPVEYALESKEEGFNSTCKEASGVNAEENCGGFPHESEWAELNTTWAQAKITGEAIERVNATKHAHGEPVAFLTADWTSWTREFGVQRGKLKDEELPAQSYYKAFEDRFHDGTLTAETLAQVASLANEERQRASRPEPAKQLGLHLSQLSQCKPRGDTWLPCHRTRNPSEPISMC